MELAIQILHVLVCVFLVLTILLQAGKGAGIGAAFGGGGGQTVFGGRGAQTFLSKLTTTGAAVFFITSLALSYASSLEGPSVVAGERAVPIEREEAPAQDAAPAAEGEASETAPEEALPAEEAAPAEGAEGAAADEVEAAPAEGAGEAEAGEPAQE